MKIGLLHPGAMGAALGALLVEAGHDVCWCSAGRSPRTAARAAEAGLIGVPSLAELVDASELVFSVCPPAAAEAVANEVAEAEFDGVFVEANAISPRRAAAIAERLARATVLDGGIIGPPPAGGKMSRLYLCGDGPSVDTVRELFSGTALRPVRVDGAVGTASALKIAYGQFQKTSRALAAVSHALADEYGVTDHLLDEARTLGQNALLDRSAFPGVAARAWRWAPEMREGAETFAAQGLPAELASAAAEVMLRWEADKDNGGLSVDTALDHLRGRSGLSAEETE